METKFEMMWRILAEEKYQRELAEQIADNIDHNLVRNEEGMKEAFEKTETILIEIEKEEMEKEEAK